MISINLHENIQFSVFLLKIPITSSSWIFRSDNFRHFQYWTQILQYVFAWLHLFVHKFVLMQLYAILENCSSVYNLFFSWSFVSTVYIVSHLLVFSFHFSLYFMINWLYQLQIQLFIILNYSKTKLNNYSTCWLLSFQLLCKSSINFVFSIFIIVYDQLTLSTITSTVAGLNDTIYTW